MRDFPQASRTSVCRRIACASSKRGGAARPRRRRRTIAARCRGLFDTRFGPLTALDYVSLDIAPGEILGVVGESGAGKSLTGTAIIGLLDPPGRVAGGDIRLDGQRIDNLPADAARRLPRELSGGMQQRVAIARALAAEPRLLLLDEPFGALDLQIRESMQEFLLNLWRSTGLSVLLITHDIDEALLLAQQVHILAPKPGRLAESLSLDLDKGDLRDLRISASFQTLRHEVADTLRQLDRIRPEAPARAPGAG